MNTFEEHTPLRSDFDYSYVSKVARVALYDDFKSAPRISEISPAPTDEYIEALTVKIYEQAKLSGGRLPYSVIREVTENFIHAQFSEIIVSILDNGNIIRFSDQGPGISKKEAAQRPGFSSAIEPMKKYIRGVGSGFPIVKDYLETMQGSIVIEDNINHGCVITLYSPDAHPDIENTLSGDSPAQTTASATQSSTTAPQQRTELQEEYKLLIDTISDRQRNILLLFAKKEGYSVTEISQELSIGSSSVFNELKKLENEELLFKKQDKKRYLTQKGKDILSYL